jgi:hypothetical protein
MGSFRPRTASAGLRAPALDERLALRRIPLTRPWHQGDADRHHISNAAELLGLANCDHDAVRIIMAARVRLRLLRMLRQTPEVRDNVRRIARARDVLLKTVVELYPYPNTARYFSVEKAIHGLPAHAGGREST